MAVGPKRRRSRHDGSRATRGPGRWNSMGATRGQSSSSSASSISSTTTLAARRHDTHTAASTDRRTGNGETPIVPGPVTVRRPDDLLLLDARFGGFVLKLDPPRLERAAARRVHRLRVPAAKLRRRGIPRRRQAVVHGAASPGEETEVSRRTRTTRRRTSPPAPDEDPPKALPMSRIRMARPSRVAVTMPAGITSIGYDAASLLAALRDWPMRLDSNAVSDRLIDLVALVETLPATAVKASCSRPSSRRRSPSSACARRQAVPAARRRWRRFRSSPRSPSCS